MPTNKIVLRETEEFMADYTPLYSPIYPLFLGKSQQYQREVGNLDFRRVTAVGDIRTKHITPKDTDIKQIGVMEGKKTYKKYFLANQFILSEFQDQQGIEDVNAQVLDEHQLQMDELFLFGEGTSNSDMLNNGLYYSADPNYSLQNSVAIASGSTRLYDFHNKVMATAQIANQVAGRKILVFYGTDIMPLISSLYETAAVPWRQALQGALGQDWSIVIMPTRATPAGASGWIAANIDQTKTHYTVLPELMKQGINEEKMYAWSTFLMGSIMLEVLAQYGVIRQPATLAA